MLKTRRILLASHGTPGARAAEKIALSMAAPGATLHHLIVVPDFWKGMMGDDWLNNVSTRNVYAKYVENELEQEVLANIRRVESGAKKRKLRYRNETALGKPADILLKRLARERFDLVVTGSPRPRGVDGLRSRLLTDDLLKVLNTRLLIIPYPRGKS